MADRKNRGTAREHPAPAVEEPSAAALARAEKPTGESPRQTRRPGRRSGVTGPGPQKAPSSRRQSTRSSSTDLVPVAETVTEGAALVGAAAADIGSFIRAQREAAEVSIRQLAERAGVSNPYLSQIERGLRKPSAEVLAQIAKGLRMSAEVLYARAGILELREGSPVRDAILTAPELTERQREVLVDVYESFRANNAVTADQVVDVE